MRSVLLVPCLLLPVAVFAQDQMASDPVSLVRRLEAAEARIKALEERLAAVGPGGMPQVGASPGAPVPGAAELPPDRPITHQSESLTFNGLVQAWYATGNASFRDTFRIRRTELYFTGRITDKARWQVMVDPSKTLALETRSTAVDGTTAMTEAAVTQSTRILQNALITFGGESGTRVTIGQFKLPLGFEGPLSSGRLDTVERALFASDRARGGALADVRDIGVLARLGGSRVDFQGGIFNGIAESPNDVDRNDQKALAGSLVFRPLAGLHVGGSGAWGNAGVGRPRRDRAGAEIQLIRGPVTLRSELMTGHDGELHRRGGYAHAGYRFTPRIEGVLRVDSWDPDTDSEASAAAVRELDYVAGVNVFLSRHNLKVQANYLRKTFHDGALPSRHQFLLNTQTFW